MEEVHGVDVSWLHHPNKGMLCDALSYHPKVVQRDTYAEEHEGVGLDEVRSLRGYMHRNPTQQNREISLATPRPIDCATPTATEARSWRT